MSVAGAANGLDERGRPIAELLAQLGDVHVDAAGFDALRVGVAPDLRKQYASAYDASLLADQQRQDFEAGPSVKVRGWILSETDVRLCAQAPLI